MPPARRLEVTAAEQQRLRQWAEYPGMPTRRRRRAQIVLLAAAGNSNAAIARALDASRACVARWRARFLAHRLAGIVRGASRVGRPPTISEELLQEIVTRTTTTNPTGGRPWTTQTLARQMGVSPKTIHRIWQANGLTPHRMRPLRRPPKGAVLRALAYVVGGYLTPWDSALVLGGDSEVWRRPPRRRVPPAQEPRPRDPEDPPTRLPGVPARYADLDVPRGYVIGWVPTFSSHELWLAFLERLAGQLPGGLEVHVFADNGAIHQHPEVQRWVDRHPAIHIHLVDRAPALPSRLVRMLRRVSYVHGQPRPGPRDKCRSLRAFVNAFSQSRRSDQPVFTWVGSREMIRLFCGGFGRSARKT